MSTARRQPQTTAPLAYATQEQIAQLFEPRSCASSPAYKLERLRARPITRESVLQDLLCTRKLPT